MPTGFIYVVRSVGSDYRQRSMRAVPTWHGDRIYFGPCKKPMRPRMAPGDYVFGLSPSNPKPRRIVFAAKIADKFTFAEAFEEFPALRGPDGPIHVRPVDRPKRPFPESQYEHIAGANHPDSWRSDIATEDLDAFFVCARGQRCEGRWLGAAGPSLDDELLAFLKSCAVYGVSGHLSERNSIATADLPVRHGNLFAGLHLETSDPLSLLRLVCSRVDSDDLRDEPSDDGTADGTGCRPTRRRKDKC